jgi:hypothetical protein
MFQLNGMVCYLLSLSLERITFEEHVSKQIKALQIRSSVLRFIMILS